MVEPTVAAMTEPGEQRPADVSPRSRRARTEAPWSRARAIVSALAVGLLGASIWAILRSVLDITVGSLVIAALGGWGIGACLRRADGSPLVAGLLAAAAWLAGLLLAWVLAMTLLAGSTRPILDRLAATPFPDWLSPQLGIVEVGALVAGVAAALYAARPPGRRAA
jgi:hypothetical protein